MRMGARSRFVCELFVYGPTSQAVGRSTEEEEDENRGFADFPYLSPAGRSSDAGVKDHSRSTVSHLKSLRI